MQVMMLRKAYEKSYGQEYSVQAQSPLAHKLADYAERLAAEGSLQVAVSYLPSSAKASRSDSCCRVVLISYLHNTIVVVHFKMYGMSIVLFHSINLRRGVYPYCRNTDKSAVDFFLMFRS